MSLFVLCVLPVSLQLLFYDLKNVQSQVLCRLQPELADGWVRGDPRHHHGGNRQAPRHPRDHRRSRHIISHGAGF